MTSNTKTWIGDVRCCCCNETQSQNGNKTTLRTINKIRKLGKRAQGVLNRIKMQKPFDVLPFFQLFLLLLLLRFLGSRVRCFFFRPYFFPSCCFVRSVLRNKGLLFDTNLTISLLFGVRTLKRFPMKIVSLKMYYYFSGGNTKTTAIRTEN